MTITQLIKFLWNGVDIPVTQDEIQHSVNVATWALKKELSERLVGVEKPDPDERAEVLAETFHVSKLEAMNVLTECNNDLRAAVKILHAKSLEESD